MSKLPKRFDAIPKVAEGRVYVAVGAGCWGKNAELAAAVTNCRKASGGSYKPGSSRTIVYDAPADTYIDNYGFICHQGNQPHAVEIGRLT